MASHPILQPENDQAKWLIFFGAGIFILLINLDVTIVNLALPVIGHQFSIPLGKLKWIINIYLISSASFFLLSGRLSEIIGHRLIFLIGALLFCLGSLISGITQNWTILLCGRTIQGIGFAFTLSQALTLIAESFPREQQGFATGLSIILTGVGQAIGPTLGGFIIHFFDWHWIFLMNVPFSIISAFIILIYCKKSHDKKTLKSLDIVNSSLFITAIIFFMTAISIVNFEHWITPSLLLILSLLFFFIFCYKNKKASHPFFDFKLFKMKAYNASIIIRFFFVLIWVALLFALPLFLQNIELYSSLEAGFIMLAMTLLIAIISPIAGKWSDQVGVRLPMIIGLVCCLISLIMLSIPLIRLNLVLLLLGLLPFGLSSGILIPMTIMGIISNIPLERKGTALGLLFTLTFVGGSVGTSIMSIILSNLSWLHFQKLSLSHNLEIPTILNLKDALSGATSVATINASQEIILLIQQSFGFAFSIALCIFILFIPFLLMLTKYFR